MGFSGEGRIQRQLRRAFIASGGSPLCIADLLTWCYPRAGRHPRWHRHRIHDALPRWAISLDRLDHRPGRPILWGPNADSAGVGVFFLATGGKVLAVIAIERSDITVGVLHL
jgi:hypothetical protein